MAQGYGSFLANQPGREEGGAAANSTLPSGGPSAPQFSVFSGDCVSKHSKCTLYCNLAVAMVAQDKIPHAQQLVGQALLALPNAAPALLIAAYLELRQGNTEGASKLLKRRRAAPTGRQGGGGGGGGRG